MMGQMIEFAFRTLCTTSQQLILISQYQRMDEMYPSDC